MNTQNHFVFLQSCWVAQSYFAEHSNPMRHQPSRKKKKKNVYQSAKNQVTQRKTHLSVVLLDIFPPKTLYFFFFNAAESPDFKGWVSHYLIPI